MPADLWTPAIGEYLPLSMLNHLPDLEESLNHIQYGEPILLGDFNPYIGQLHHHCN